MGKGLAVSGTIVAALALALSGPAHADVKAGVDAWSRGDFASAIKQWQGPAAAGDADAQFNLAQAYRLGNGVPQDLAKAEELFGRAAAQGHLAAADNYGVLLFQRGAREQALPYIRAAADRGEPRAQYLLGLAHFNGDLVPKDWVRGYALVSLAQQAGLAPAANALAIMDKYVPLDQRKLAVSLAADLAAQAEANRARQVAQADLAGSRPASAPATSSKPFKVAAPAPPAVAIAAKPPARPVQAPSPAAPAVSGPWRVQLGAFGVAGNADALWARLRARPELAGHSRIDAKAGAVTKLMAGGFASQAAAQQACKELASAGFSCLAVKN